jgi:nucleoside-diphosphate-sugar epimerase
MSQRILITGATGFVGANLTRFFLKKNYHLHLLVRDSSNLWRLKGCLAHAHKYRVDLRQKQKLQQIVKKVRPQFIIHTAAASISRNQHLSYKSMVDINLTGTINLLTAANQIDYQAFIHTSSSSEYAPQECSLKETDSCLPRDIYGITKLASTHYAQITAHKHHQPIIILRLFSPYGPFDDPKKLVPYAINQTLRGQTLKLANPQAARDYIYITDVSSAYEKALKLAAQYPGEIFNLGSGKQTSVKKIISTIIKITNSTSPVSWGRVKPSHQDTKHWQANISKTKKLLNWQPKYNLRQGLEKTIAFYQNTHLSRSKKR